jgi:hypothetical protein
MHVGLWNSAVLVPYVLSLETLSVITNTHYKNMHSNIDTMRASASYWTQLIRVLLVVL